MKIEISIKRWKEAQEYERKYWGKVKETNSDFYLMKSLQMRKEIDNYVELTESSKILQIGCGPEDVIHNWAEAEKYGIDPQMDYYNQRKILKYNGVTNIKGIGENLPFNDNYFDLIIINNVLDHCYNPKRVLEEANRCLKENGIIYTETNVRSSILYPFLKMVWWTRISTAKGHPFIFTNIILKDLIISSKFKLLKEGSVLSKLNFGIFMSLQKLAKYLLESQYYFICKRNYYV